MQYIILFILFILFPICGFQSLQKGDIGSAIFFLFPLFALVCGIIINLCVIEPRKKRQKALREMYKIPIKLNHEFGEQWGREFQKIIREARKNTSDTDKLQDLEHCSQTVQNISKWPMVGMGDEYYLNSAFRYTGCHLKVTDSNGNIISVIV